MNNQYPDPAYEDAIKMEEMEKKMKKMEEKMEDMERLIQLQGKIIKEEKAENDRLRKKWSLRKFKVAPRVRDYFKGVNHDEIHQGIVVSAPLPYKSPDQRNYLIDSYNWVYSPRLGLIRSMNKKNVAPDMKFGKWYYFKTNDERKKKLIRPPEAEPLTHLTAIRAVMTEKRFWHPRTSFIRNGKLEINVVFALHGSMLYNADKVYVEDEFLNKVHLNKKMISVILTATNRGKLDVPLKIKTIVTLESRFLQIYELNENSGVFTVQSIRTIQLEGEDIIQLA